MIRPALSALLVALALACASPAQPAVTQPASQPAAAPPVAQAPALVPAGEPPAAPPAPAAIPSGRSLLFFLNPGGRPCQMQKAILDGMGATLTDAVRVQFLSVGDEAARPAFGAFGIRALPALILVDQQGRELHRFTPGIHEAAEIAAVLGG